jgi:hypothetical protein
MGKVDLTDGFFHRKVAVGSRKYLGIKLPDSGELMRYTVFPFGLSVSPHYFCAAISEVHRLLRQHSLFKGAPVINLPSCEGYDPAKPTVYQVTPSWTGRDDIETMRWMKACDGVVKDVVPHKRKGGAPKRGMCKSARSWHDAGGSKKLRALRRELHMRMSSSRSREGKATRIAELRHEVANCTDSHCRSKFWLGHVVVWQAQTQSSRCGPC